MEGGGGCDNGGGGGRELCEGVLVVKVPLETAGALVTG